MSVAAEGPRCAAAGKNLEAFSAARIRTFFGHKAKEEIGSDVAVQTSRSPEAPGQSAAADGKARLAVGCRR